METVQLKILSKTLDDIKHQNGVEYWLARELCPILGYTRWESFQDVLVRAKNACKNSGANIDDHFRDVPKMVESGIATKDIGDIKLTRYACYLVAVNGDPRKEAIAFAQAYFVSSTRQFEVLQERMIELERLDSREKLKITEKEFADMAFSRGVDSKGIAYVRSVGDKALFGGRSTNEMKQKLHIKDNKPLADFLPNITLKAKDLATAMTTESARKKNIRGAQGLANEHQGSNQNIRMALVKTGIYPEELPAAEDIKKIESKHRKEKKELEKRQREELEKASQKQIESKN